MPTQQPIRETVKRTLLIGGRGQIGSELSQLLPSQAETLTVDRTQLDLVDPDQIVNLIRDWRPDIVVNAAAYTAVDKAETHERDAFAINAEAPRLIAEESRRLGAMLVHYSTDYVFDGKKNSPYVEDDAPNPINAYGRSKLAGENAIRASGVRHLILRTSWVYGLYGNNFLLTMLKLARERDEIRVVADQRGTPNWSQQLAKATAQLMAMQVEGLFHLTSQGDASWFDFAKSIFAQTKDVQQRPILLTPITSDEYPLPAARPSNSRLSGAALKAATGIELPMWDIALSRCLGGSSAIA